MHLLDDSMAASIPSAGASMGSAPKEATASTSSPLFSARHSAATSSSGFSTPVLVSQCTTITWLIAASAAIAARNCSTVGGVNGSVRRTAAAMPSASQISISRSPYTPLVCTRSLRPGGTRRAMAASLA